MREIDGPMNSFFEVNGKKYEYEFYGLYSYDKTLSKIAEKLNNCVEHIYNSSKNEKNSDKEPLLVWRRKIETSKDEDKVCASCRFIIVSPEEADEVEEYLKNAKQS